jgi:hypothetical protein
MRETQVHVECKTLFDGTTGNLCVRYLGRTGWTTAKKKCILEPKGCVGSNVDLGPLGSYYCDE